MLQKFDYSQDTEFKNLAIETKGKCQETKNVGQEELLLSAILAIDDEDDNFKKTFSPNMKPMILKSPQKQSKSPDWRLKEITIDTEIPHESFC